MDTENAGDFFKKNTKRLEDLRETSLKMVLDGKEADFMEKYSQTLFPGPLSDSYKSHFQRNLEKYISEGNSNRLSRWYAVLVTLAKMNEDATISYLIRSDVKARR
jgi:hypothetical protein